MAMGIDQEIQRRMDAYRGNPQGLQQRYQMSQQLLDLLALQKLKAEKDAVARQMQAQMQQQPGTVAQQLEQEMMGRTKQDLAQQTAGIMQQRQQQQQKAMQQMAKSMSQPRPMPGGIGALAPQTAQPGRRMAGGGIVAFAEGDLLDERVQAIRERADLTDAEKAEMISNLATPVTAAGIPEDVGMTAAQEDIATLRKRGDPMAKSRAAQANAAEVLRREALRKASEERLQGLEALDTAQLDPKQMRRDRLLSFLAGASGKRAGFVGKGGLESLMAKRQEQQQDVRGRQLERFGLAEDIAARDVEIGQSVLGSGDIAYQEAGAAERTAAQQSTGMFQSRVRAATEAANRDLKAAIANNELWVDVGNQLYTRAQNAIENRISEVGELRQLLRDINDQIEERTNALETNLGYTARIRQAETPEERQALMAELRAAAMAQVNGVGAGDVETEQGLLDLAKQIRDRLAELQGSDVGLPEYSVEDLEDLEAVD